MKTSKKIISCISIIVIILGTIMLIVGGILKLNDNEKQMAFLVECIIGFVVIFIVLALALVIIINTISVIKKGTQNIKRCGDPLFESIDRYKRGSSESSTSYIKQIKIINLYYKEGGKVDELINKGEIDRLFARVDFLNIQNNLYDDLNSSFHSFAISIIASILIEAINDNIIITIIMLIVIACIFMMVIFSRYIDRGQVGTYRYMIDEYERKLLVEKITNFEKSIKVFEHDEEFIETNQTAINELQKYRRNKKGNLKEKIARDIEIIENLNLCVEDYTKYHKTNIYINNNIGYLLYNEKGEENNYIGELNLLNKEYSILYRILNKYELIEFR